MATPSANAKLMYRQDRKRAFLCGMLEAGFLTFAIPISIRCFDAPEWIKASLVGAGFIGLMCTPLSIALTSRINITVSRLWAIYLALAAITLFVGILFDGLIAFALSLGVAHFIYAQQIPLATHLYVEHYPMGQQGGRVSTSLGILALSGILYAQAGGWLLDWNLGNYKWIQAGMSIAALLAAISVWKIPSRPFNRADTGNLWSNISLIWRDRLFGWMVLSWMMVGFAMLMCHPLRQEYVANPRYAMGLDNTKVAWIIFIIPAISHILSVKFWGWLYEKINFIGLRIGINLLLILFLLIYFNTRDIVWLGIGSALMGFALGGGKLTWSLWVTRIAPPERVSSYMSTHTAIAGLRGVVAPFAAYALLNSTGIHFAAMLAAGSITLSAILFACVGKHPRFAHHK